MLRNRALAISALALVALFSALSLAPAVPVATADTATPTAPATASAPSGGDALTPAQQGRVTPVVLAYRKAKPAIVNISTEQVVTVGLFGDDPMEQIFPSPYARKVPVQSLGSGFLIHPSGYVVTNAHVVRRAQKISVTLADGVKYDARVISADTRHDLAVLKVEPPKGGSLPYLPLGRSDDLMVGETVIAIGNPLGYSDTVSTGIVSATGRTLEFGQGVSYTGLIQTDAPINPGNSGGPLLNVNGEVIGINSAIRADAQNIGFAIASDTLAEEFGKLLDFQRINRVVFGAAVAQRHSPAGDSVVVTEVAAGTPADGKLAKGDTVLAVNGAKTRQITDFTCDMMNAGAAAPVTLAVLRAGKQIGVEIALTQKPKPDVAALAWQLMGIKVTPLTRELAREQGLVVESGLLVVGLDAGGPAEKIGVRVKDVLFQIDTLYVKDTESLGNVLEDAKAGQQMRIGIVRGNVAAWAALKLRSAETKNGPTTAATRPGADGK